MTQTFLYLASGTDLSGAKRRFSVYQTASKSFKIYNESGTAHKAHPTRQLTPEDIRLEISLIYSVDNIQLESAR